MLYFEKKIYICNTYLNRFFKIKIKTNAKLNNCVEFTISSDANAALDIWKFRV